jgi:hypothetical protein
MARSVDEVHLSQLQDKILRIVCTRQNVDYTFLMKETNRDRVTIAQSVNSLVDRHYVSKDKIDPEYEKSKVIVKATFPGKDYSVKILKVNLEEILKAEDNEYISAFLEFIKDMPDSQRHKLIDPLNELFNWLTDLWWTEHIAKGKFSVTRGRGELNKQYDKIIKNVLIHGLKTGISQLVLDENYDSNKLLNKRSIESLRKFLTNTEIKELRQFIMHMKDSIIATAEKFPQ